MLLSLEIVMLLDVVICFLLMIGAGIAYKGNV